MRSTIDINGMASGTKMMTPSAPGPARACARPYRSVASDAVLAARAAVLAATASLPILFGLITAARPGAAQSNISIIRSAINDRIVEVLAEGSGDRQVGMRQDAGRLLIAAAGHEIIVTADGGIRIDGVAKPAIASLRLRVVIRGGRVEVTPLD